MNISLDIFGEKGIKERFGQRAKDIHNFKPAFEAIQDDFYMTERKLFGSEGGSGASGTWKPLAPWYSAWKQQQGRGETILVFQGNMYSSLVNKGDKNSIADLSETSMTLGTKDPKASKHYKGDGVPVRKPIDVTDNDKARWFKLVQKWIVDVLHGKVEG